MKTSVLTTALLLVAGTLSAQAPLSAWWALDETSGTIATDASGNGNHGTLVNFAGTPWGPALLGNGLMFDGVDDHVDCAANGGLPVSASGAAYSIMGWVNAPAQSDKRIYSEGSGASNVPLVAIGSGTSSQPSIRVYIRNDSGSVRLQQQSITPVFDGTWHHFAWVDSGTGAARLYVDGVLDAADFNYVPLGTYTTNRVSLGAVLRAGTCCHMIGTLDEVRAYPFAATETDIGIVLGNGTLGTGYQSNQPAASLYMNGFSSSIASAGQVNVAQGGQITLTLSTSLGGFPWELVTSPAPAVPNALILDPNNTVNVLLASAVFVNGFFSTPWGTPSALPGFPPTAYFLSSSVVYTAPLSPLFLTAQFAMVNPAAAGGLSMGGVIELVVP